MLYYWQTKYTTLIYITFFIFSHNRHFFVHISPSVLEVWKFPCGRTRFQPSEDTDALLSELPPFSHPSSNTARTHAHTSISTLKSLVNFCSTDFLFHKEFDDSTLAKRHIIVGHFVRSDTGHVMQATGVTKHSRITQQLVPSTTALSFVCCSQFACKKKFAHDFRYDPRKYYSFYDDSIYNQIFENVKRDPTVYFVRRLFPLFALYADQCPIWWRLIWTAETCSGIEYWTHVPDLRSCVCRTVKVNVDGYKTLFEAVCSYDTWLTACIWWVLWRSNTANAWSAQIFREFNFI